jgi:hypothetical protein
LFQGESGDATRIGNFTRLVSGGKCSPDEHSAQSSKMQIEKTENFMIQFGFPEEIAS